ncbi:MAG: ATP-grasp domain-containing protein [Actinobacteria bacterium]|nr:ATP-grasp domain-containing protein [Actinomycetota bacterium]
MILVVPADVLRPRLPDEHFAAEARAAAEAGIAVAVVDHDGLREPGGAEAAVARVPRDSGEALYRGWMLSGNQYSAFAHALAGRGATLRASADQYRHGHEFPGWYPALASVTPQSAWTAGDLRDDFSRACTSLGPGPAVVRDYVKSMKHYWDEAAFVPDLSDTAAAWRIASRFRELREDEFTGGFVVRRFEQFISAEARTWWVDGTCRLVTAHPDTPGDLPPAGLDLAPFAPVIASLNLPFITADLVQRDDGIWRVIEVGDGQVSDRPETTSASAFVTAILN